MAWDPARALTTLGAWYVLRMAGRGCCCPVRDVPLSVSFPTLGNGHDLLYLERASDCVNYHQVLNMFVLFAGVLHVTFTPLVHWVAKDIQHNHLRNDELLVVIKFIEALKLTCMLIPTDRDR